MTVSLTVALMNLVLGTVYTCYGLLTIVDMRRGWRTSGFSHFGAAWIFMAFTCGPHHLDHAIHGFLGRSGGWLDLFTIAVGFPVGVVWFLLRVEAMFGGRGDRFITGTPMWLRAMPTAVGSYVVAVLAVTLWMGESSQGYLSRITPNLLLIALYSAIALVLLRTQLGNHPVTGGWSVSGLSLSAVMFTCAVMHGVFALYANTGRYELDPHGLFIDTLSVPAAMYFLWVVFSLHRGTLNDWNARPADLVVAA